MPRRLSPTRRLTTAARWPVGLGLTAWRYLWRTTPLHRRELPGSAPQDAAPPLPSGVDTDEVQDPADGVGPLFHRRYRVRVRDSRLSADELMRRVSADPNAVSPKELAHFGKVRGREGEMRVGDEFVVRMPGPWDGPVRAVAVTPASFRFVTLDGHLEAGQIEFRARDEGRRVVFEIESWARSATRLTNLLYHRLRMSKEIQLHIWSSFLESVVDLTGGRADGGLDIETHRVEEERALNYLPDEPRGEGWKVDDYCQPLPSGSFAAAQQLMRDYEFADPDIVRAAFPHDAPLEGRNMMLELRFWGLRFHAGVRVCGVHDAEREVDGRRVRVWGWSYRTLQGHLEMGQMDYELWEWQDTGEVQFRIHAVSHPARIRNPIVRLGFHLFGRREQVRFARHACERMARLTAGERVPSVAERVAVRAS